MDRIDRLQAHIEALEQQTEQLKHETQALKLRFLPEKRDILLI